MLQTGLALSFFINIVDIRLSIGTCANTDIPNLHCIDFCLTSWKLYLLVFSLHTLIIGHLLTPAVPLGYSR